MAITFTEGVALSAVTMEKVIRVIIKVLVIVRIPARAIPLRSTTVPAEAEQVALRSEGINPKNGNEIDVWHEKVLYLIRNLTTYSF